MTKYKGCNPSSPEVAWFWEAMVQLSPQEHSLFLRFVWCVEEVARRATDSAVLCAHVLSGPCYRGRTRLSREEADFQGKHFVLQVRRLEQPAVPGARSCIVHPVLVSFDFSSSPFQLMDKYEAGSAVADRALPEALTCFFLLKVPRYVRGS